MKKNLTSLVLSRFRPDRLSGGAALRNWQNIQGLAKLGEVDVLSLGDEDGANRAPNLPGVRDWKHFEMATFPVANGGRRSRRWMLQPGCHPSIARYERPEVIRWIQERVASTNYDVAVVEELSLARYIPILKEAGIRVVFDAHNVEATLRAEMDKASGDRGASLRSRFSGWLLSRRLMMEERKAARDSDVVWACSDLDASIIAREYDKPATTVPNGVNVDAYQHTGLEADSEDWARAPLTLVFLGSYSYYPNEEAAMRLIEGVMPLVRKSHADAKLILIGRDPTSRMLEASKADDSIVVTGGVPSVMPYLKAPGIVTIPLTLGSGTRLKILEAFAAGSPVVSTAKGAEGLDVVDGKELRICETAEEMAAAAIKLWNDRAARTSQCAEALNLVRNGYSWPVAASRISASLSPSKGADAWFIPFYGENPYQSKLAEGLEEQGFKVGDRPEGMRGLIGDTLKSPRVIHLHWLPRFNPGLKGLMRAIQYVVRLRVLKLMGAPIVWTVHNLYHHEAKAPKRDRWVYRQVIDCVTRAIAHSKAAKDALIEEFQPKKPSKVEVIPHGHYIGSYENSIERNEARQKLDLAPDSVTFLFLGMIRPYKGILELLETYRSIGGSNTELVIAGRPLDDETERLVREEVRGRDDIKLRLGFVPDDEIQTYMNACDAVVFPYRDVLTSGAVVLAMSFGKACIAPRLGCIPDMIGESGGFLYDPESASGLAGALEGAVERKGDLSTMGDRNTERAADWGWDRIGRETADVYRAALASEKSPSVAASPSSTAVGSEGTA
ncbi:glycosyltransferase family 4 protein [Haloferula sp.]|uniref:glycosyltransferase family 4 protein n=1 Tax=Haloferula sp. TaxID=2497595 RepID=UPI0032A0F9E1